MVVHCNLCRLTFTLSFNYYAVTFLGAAIWRAIILTRLMEGLVRLHAMLFDMFACCLLQNAWQDCVTKGRFRWMGKVPGDGVVDHDNAKLSCRPINYNYLARSANLPTGLYILLALISFFF